MTRLGDYRKNGEVRGIGVALTAALLLGALSGTGPAAATQPPEPPSGSTAAVGALYFPSVLGLAPALGLPHGCTASVVHSPGHNLAITAGHCISGTGLGYEFVPGYRNGDEPYGVWTVQSVYVNSAWAGSHDPQHDYAFLRLAPRRIGGRVVNVEDLTGGNTLGRAPAPGTIVAVTGYVAGTNDAPVACAAATYMTDGYPAFDCSGFADGTSGSPWLTGSAPTTLVGVIGGLHQGGCTDQTSYSSAFGDDTMRDWQRAASAGRADVVTPPPSDGCGAP
jgi:hypothetical protein